MKAAFLLALILAGCARNHDLTASHPALAAARNRWVKHRLGRTSAGLGAAIAGRPGVPRVEKTFVMNPGPGREHPEGFEAEPEFHAGSESVNKRRLAAHWAFAVSNAP